MVRPPYAPPSMPADIALAQIPAFLRPAGSAVNLAVVRIMCCSAALLWTRPDRLVDRATLEAPRVPPTLTGTLLLDLPRSTAVVAVAAVGLTVSLVLGLIGWRTRPALFSAVVLWWYVVGLTQTFGKVDHSHHLLWFLVVLAASPCSDALAIDAYGRRRPHDSPAYGFPVRVIWLLIGLAYFSAGLWKLGSIGFEWITSDNLRNLIWSERLARGGCEPWVDITGSPLLLRAGALFAVVFELGFVFLVFTRARPVAVALGVIFHMSTWATMGISFLTLVTLYGVFFDWTDCVERFGSAWRRLTGAASSVRQQAARPQRGGLVVVVLPLTLVVLVALAGASRELNGWPVASYPDFGYRVASEQSMVTLRAGGEPVRIPGLGAIEQQRLLLRAVDDPAARSAIAHALDRDGRCRPMRGGEPVVVQVLRVAVENHGLVPRPSPPPIPIADCRVEPRSN